MKKVNLCQVQPEPSAVASPDDIETHNGTNENLAGVRLPSVIVGRIVALLESDEPLVDFPGNAFGKLVPARSLVPIKATETGREVALTFDNGDPGLPIIIGLLQATPSTSVPHREVRLDDESLLLSAKREVVIQCGKASITLTSAGKVLIQGEYLLSRSSGVNKIRGGSIQLN